MNANIMKVQVFHRIMVVIIPSDLITSLTYVLMDKFVLFCLTIRERIALLHSNLVMDIV